MATKVEANPLQSGGKIDLTDPTSAVKKIVMMVLGFGIFFMALAFGQDLGQFLQNRISSTTGVDTGSSGPSMEFTA